MHHPSGGGVNLARVWMFGDDVDTDQILPGRFAPYLQPDEEVADFAFYEARPEFANEAREGDIIVAGHNFGCGSSREYAPEALKRRGIAAIFAPSFARIFYRNCVNLGLPLYFTGEVSNALQDGDWVELDIASSRLTTRDQTLQIPPLSPFVSQIIEAGGITSYVRKHGDFPAFQEA